MTYVSRFFMLFCRICLFWVKVFSSFHYPHSFASVLAIRVMLLFHFQYPLQRIFVISLSSCFGILFCLQIYVLISFLTSSSAFFAAAVFKKCVFLGNFTLLDAYCLDCPSSFFLIPFVSSYLQSLFLFFVLVYLLYCSFCYPLSSHLIIGAFLVILLQMPFLVIFFLHLSGSISLTRDLSSSPFSYMFFVSHYFIQLVALGQTKKHLILCMKIIS